MIRTFLTVFALALALAGAAEAQTRYDDLQMMAIEDGGARRSVGLYVPASYHAGQPAPLIVALHGRFSSAKAFHAISGLAAVADARGAILVYPETVGAFWNDGGFAQLGRQETPQDDTGFISAVLAALRQEYSIDSERVFLVGYDQGGSLAYRMTCDGPLHLAGVVAVSAQSWDYAATPCSNAPSPLLIVHGRGDDLVPVNGGSPGPRVNAQRLSADAMIARWRGVNGCDGAPSASGREDSVVYLNCSRAAFAYVGVPGGEHDWFREGPAYQLNHQGVDTAALVDRFLFDRAAFALPNGRASGGHARAYIMYAPPNYDPSRPTPIVVVLHGRPQNATGIALTTRMNAVAARHGFLVVYPEGLNHEWNGVLDLRGTRSVAPQDDVRFLETLMSDLAVDFNIDRARMYVTGFSNGAFMTIRMACDAADTFAAFAEVSGELYTELTRGCRNGRKAPIMFIHGTADESVPYRGVIQQDGQGREPTVVSLGAQETVAYFVRKNGCSMSGESARLAERGQSPGSYVIRFTPRDCAPGGQIVFYLINGAGHNWPGEEGPNPGPAGIINQDFDASEAIWDFFSRQSLPQADQG